MYSSKLDHSGFVTKNGIKLTIAGRPFLHESSYHLLDIFKGIVFNEAMRLRRLNEKHEDYINSKRELKNKCLNSLFNKKVTQTIIQKISTWAERSGPSNHKKESDSVGNKAFHNFFNSLSKNAPQNQKSMLHIKYPHVWQIH